MSSTPANSIRSFVRREGRITRAQRRALAEFWPLYGIDPGVVSVDLHKLFGRKVPVIMEIGCGNGDTLVELAANDPHCDFLGVEVYRPGLGSTLQKLRQLGLTNVKLFGEDAVGVLRDRISAATLTKILIFFPDPWPKKRHHKRRLIQPDFVRLAAERLVIGGQLHLATDCEDYAEHMLEVLAGEKSLRNTAANAGYTARPGYRPETKYERRGRGLGHAV
ncbi:MAG: tRNA (guanosine(46)-N7)-methyltransferase TrmB, partial [Gammaproteobacteria bacterium]|nr:tRNA (guanosine(46)-N7)-methyltransferase TrmB [Gammaproteobacteria bacterium]